MSSNTEIFHKIVIQLKLLQQSKEDMRELLDKQAENFQLYHKDFCKCCREIRELEEKKKLIQDEMYQHPLEVKIENDDEETFGQFCEIDREGEPIYLKYSS